MADLSHRMLRMAAQLKADVILGCRSPEPRYHRTMFPIRLGTDADFTALREALRACEAALQQPAAVRLFIDGATIDRSAVSSLPIPELETLGLISTVADRIVANVMLYRTRGLLIVSDRNQPKENDSSPPPEDIVYPANIANTCLFLDHIPPGTSDAFLDLCAGTGIAALAAAQSGATHAWAFDITARSTHFAEFNRRLNGISNVTPARGDLYEPAGDQTFDRIVAHPPYLPVYRPRFVFDSGGQDGEQIVRRIVEGLPKYLRPGGKFYALTMGSDREQPFEHRLREWLGEAASEFDIAFVVRKTVSPREYSADAVVAHKGAAADISGWRALFEQWGVRALVYGFVVIQRRSSDRPVFTVRRDAGPNTGPEELAWLVEWETRALDAQKLLSAKPRASQNASLQVEHRFIEGAWQPESHRLRSEYPFIASIRTEPWAAHLLTLANGSLTVAELLDQLPGSANPIEFARAVAAMVSAGFLDLDR
jgi:SAM-dependent methyltransferase